MSSILNKIFSKKKPIDPTATKSDIVGIENDIIKNIMADRSKRDYYNSLSPRKQGEVLRYIVNKRLNEENGR